MQIIVLDFNIVFNLHGIMKLTPSLCVLVGVLRLTFYCLNLFGGSYSIESLRLNEGNYEACSDILAKMWFMPPLRSDFFSDKVLGLSGDIKSLVEDGYLEYSFGSDSV